MNTYFFNKTGQAGTCPHCGNQSDDLIKFELTSGEKHKDYMLCYDCAKRLHETAKSRGYQYRPTTVNQTASVSDSNQYYDEQVAPEYNKNPFLKNGDLKKLIKTVAIIVIAIVVVLVLAPAVVRTISIISNSVSSSIATKNFEIEGTWRNIGEDTCAQIQRGSVVSFDGTNCNVYSPRDTYAFYKDGSNYHLTCTSFFAGDSMEFVVTVRDNDHISMDYYGRGETVVELERVS